MTIPGPGDAPDLRDPRPPRRVQEAPAGWAPLDLATGAAAGALAASLVLATEVGVRAWVGAALGGRVSRVRAYDVVGSWETVPEAGSILLASAGPVAVGALGALGWLLFRRGEGCPTTLSVVGWMLFVYGSWVQVAHLVADPLLGFGGWMEAIDRFPNRGPVRASMVASGLFLAGLVWKETARSMAFLVGNGASAARRARGGALTRSGWMAGSAVLLGAMWPAPMTPAVWTGALVAIVGTAPVLAAAARVDQRPVRGVPLQVHLSGPLVLAAVVAAAAVVLILGPGIEIVG